MRWYEKDHFSSLRGWSDAVARQFSWITANWISVFRIILSFPMLLLLAGGHLAWGAALYGLNGFLDFLDGAVARQQQAKTGTPAIGLEEERELSYWQRLNLPGITNLGKFMDPLADKFMNVLALVPLGWNLFPRWMLFLSVGFAFGLTISRPLLRRLFGHDGSANKFGKFKMMAEIAAVAAVVFTLAGVSEKAVAYVLLLVAVGLGITGLVLVSIEKIAPVVLRAAIGGALGLAVLHAFLPERIIAFWLLVLALALAALSLLFQWHSAVFHWLAARRKPKTPAG